MIFFDLRKFCLKINSPAKRVPDRHKICRDKKNILPLHQNTKTTPMKKSLIAIITCIVLGLVPTSCTKETTSTQKVQHATKKQNNFHAKILGKWQTTHVNKFKDGILRSTHPLDEDRIFSYEFSNNRTLIYTNKINSIKQEYLINDSILRIFSENKREIFKIKSIKSDTLKLIFDYNDGDFDEYIFARTKW